MPEFDESDEEISNLISQPDIVVIYDDIKLRKTGYFGVPTLVIEVSSPSTAKKDKVLKFKKFQKAGVKEYWIVEPEGKFVNYLFSLLSKIVVCIFGNIKATDIGVNILSVQIPVIIIVVESFSSFAINSGFDFAIFIVSITIAKVLVKIPLC